MLVIHFLTISVVVNQAVLDYVFIPLLLSILIVIGGFYMRKGNGYLTYLLSSVNWRQQLEAWDVHLEKNSISTTLHEVELYWRMTRSYSLIGAGILTFLTIIGIISVSALTKAGLSTVPLLNGELLAVVLGFAMFVGYGVGYMCGVEQMKHSTSRHIIYADLRRRRASDYCSPLLQSIPIGVIIYNGINAFLIAPYLGPTLSIQLLGGGQFTLPNNPLLLSVVPCLIALAILLFALLLTRVASLPRIVAASDIAIAQRVDDMVRALSIGQLLSFEFCAVGLLTFAEFTLLRPIPPVPTYVSIIQLFGWLLYLGLILSGCMLGTCRGQLGGSISGWWWQSRDNAE